MKKKILLVIASLLLVTMFITPAIAAHPNRYDVTATQIGSGVTGLIPHVSLHGNRVVLQLRNGAGEGVVTLNLPGGPIEGTTEAKVWGKIQFFDPMPDPNAVGIWQAQMVWSFTDQGGKTGTFEGIRKFKVIGYPRIPTILIPYTETFCILRGTGDFRGQTLKLSFEGDAEAGISWVGTLLMPK